MMSDPNTTPENAPVPDDGATREDVPEPVAGLLAEFDGPRALKAAAARVRDEGFLQWDVLSPFPIHGIERAMGLRPTRLPWLVLGGGMVGCLLALLMQWWMNAIDYPHVISGKPLWSLPANIPITFEVIVLLSALAAFLGTLALNRLPQFSHPLLGSERFRRATTDGFFLWIEAADPKFDRSATGRFVESLGPVAVEACGRQTAGRSFPPALGWTAAVAISLALLPPLGIAWYRAVPKKSPRIHLVGDMDFQPKYKTQAASPLFDDHRAMRPQVPGTIAEGQLEDDEHLYRGKVDGQRATTFPGPVSRAMAQRGRERFDIFCAPCHGLVGDGQGMTSLRAIKREEKDWRPPTSLHKSSVRQRPVGQLYNTIVNGLDKMPGYGPQIPVDDRWAIVLYIRALQRSQNAGIDDVPEEFRSQLRQSK